MPPDQPARVLAFDTSGPWIAAALLIGDRVFWRDAALATGQAEALIPLLQDLLSEAGCDWRDLSVIAVGTGPGNFTGVRIAVAAARGLALGLGVPAQGVTIFEALAHGAPRPCRVVQDARRDAVYVQEFTVGGAGSARLLADPGAFDGMTLGVGGENAPFPLAEAIARIAATRPPGLRPAPFYLRGPEAALPTDPPPVMLDA